METRNKMDGKHIGKQQCTNCKCWRIPDNYIGKSGSAVKRCLKCREKDDRQKKKPNVIEKRNERQREKKYYVEYREKKRQENEEEYLQHNADIAKNWRDNNKEHLSAWRTNNFTSRFSGIKQQAKKKGLAWNDNMTNIVCEKLMRSNCVYCGFLSEDTLNGIDRMDSQQGYSITNCVSCCKNCNFIKKCLDPITFIARCQHISHIHNGPEKISKDVWCDSGSVDYKAYLRRACLKDLEFELTQANFDTLRAGICFYCHKVNTSSHQNGIDRKDNSQGYTLNNCVTCCRECNQMKSDMSAEEFITHCKSVECGIAFDDTMRRMYRTINSRQNTQVI